MDETFGSVCRDCQVLTVVPSDPIFTMLPRGDVKHEGIMEELGPNSFLWLLISLLSLWLFQSICFVIFSSLVTAPVEAACRLTAALLMSHSWLLRGEVAAPHHHESSSKVPSTKGSSFCSPPSHPTEPGRHQVFNIESSDAWEHQECFCESDRTTESLLSFPADVTSNSAKLREFLMICVCTVLFACLFPWCTISNALHKIHLVLPALFWPYQEKTKRKT